MVLDVREILRRIQAGESDRAIARDLAIARKTVGRYRLFADGQGLLQGPLPPPDELQRSLQATLGGHRPPQTPFKAAPFASLIEQWRRDGVEMRAIFQRLRDDHCYTGSYSALHRYVTHTQQHDPEAFVRIEVAPGEEAQVDFGYAGKQLDPRTGQLRRAWVFVMTLSFSRHQYATLVFDQTVPTWLRCHREAFEYFGGVPRRVVIDNLKAGIVRACFHDQVVQRSYRELAEHYGFLIAPCRPRTARHKGKVESGVHYVARNFLPGKAEQEITQTNAQLLTWIETTAGLRIHGTTRQQPLLQFHSIERGALLALPPAPYDLGCWKQLRLYRDCHVVLDGAYYSAPHRLIGKQLWVRSNGRDVWIFHQYERVATHLWGPPGTRRTNDAHYPQHKVAALRATPQSCQARADEIGPCASEVIARLLGERPLDRLRTAAAILTLADRHSERRLEAACRRALCFDDIGYATLKRILERGLESEPLPNAAPPSPSRIYAFARPGSEIFGGLDHGHKTPVDPQAEVPATVGHPGDPGCPQSAGDRGQAQLRRVPRAAAGG